MKLCGLWAQRKPEVCHAATTFRKNIFDDQVIYLAMNQLNHERFRGVDLGHRDRAKKDFKPITEWLAQRDILAVITFASSCLQGQEGDVVKVSSL